MLLRRFCLAAALTAATGLAACSPPEEEETAETFPGAGQLPEPNAAPAATPPQQQPPVGDNSVEIHTSGAEPADRTATGSNAGR